jgi:hypothetical protein
MDRPRCEVSRNAGPKSAADAISASSHGPQARISIVLGFPQRPIEQLLPCWAGKARARDVFLFARLFAHEHERRSGTPLTEDGLRRRREEFASPAAGSRFAQRPNDRLDGRKSAAERPVCIATSAMFPAAQGGNAASRCLRRTSGWRAKPGASFPFTKRS